jgi:hypothetical protein
MSLGRLESNGNFAGCVRGAKQHDAIAEACGLPDIVGDEYDGLSPGFPDPLNVAIGAARESAHPVPKRLIHEQDARIGSQSAGKRDPLFHASESSWIWRGKAPESDQVDVVAAT